MEWHLNIFSLLILLGCLQGIILAVMLGFKTKRSKADLFLSFLLLAYSLNNLSAIFFDTGWSMRVPQLLFLPFVLILGIGPSLYLHARYCVEPSRLFSPKDYLHFIPVIIEFSWYTAASIFFVGRAEDIVPFYRFMEPYYSIPEQLAGIVSVGVYTIKTLLLLQKSKLLQKDTSASGEAYLTNRRLQVLVTLLGLGWFIWVVLIAIDIIVYDFRLDQDVYYPLYLVMAATVYAIGYSSYFNRIVITDAILQKPDSTELEHADLHGAIDFSTTVTQENLPLDTGLVKATSQKLAVPLSPEHIHADLGPIAQQLKIAVETHKMYLDPELRLKTVADGLGLPQKKISAALKHVLQTNFYDYINQFRVRAVEQRLADPAFSRLTFTSIAFDCGFNSKSTFNHIFKKITGKTPKEYKNGIQKDVRITDSDVGVR